MSALKLGKPKETETPVKNLSIEIQEEIIWFHIENRLNQWVIQQPHHTNHHECYKINKIHEDRDSG